MTEEFKKEGRIIVDGVNVISCKYFLFRDEPSANERTCGIGLTSCKGKNCDFKEIANLKRENKEKIDIIEQMIKILYPNASDDELYDVTFNGEYIDKLKELKDTADTMLMANDIKKQDIDSLREVNERLEQENEKLKKEVKQIGSDFIKKGDYARELEQENKELKEWKTKVVMLFESACRCKHLNEETDICSYTNEKCMNINKCVYKYQELSNTYRSALEEIKEVAKLNQFYNPENLLINGDIGQIQNLKMTEIYNKIKEVLNASK